VFKLEVAGKVGLTLTFLSTMFTDDYVRLSRPAYYINSDVRSLDGAAHKVQLYLDASAEHAVNIDSQTVSWSSWNTTTLQGIQIGNSVQNVLGSKGDKVNIDWGFLHMGVSNDNTISSTLYSGSAATAQAAFRAGGVLPSTPDSRMPRAVSDDLPTLAVAADLGSVGATDVDSSFLVMLGYDDVKVCLATCLAIRLTIRLTIRLAIRLPKPTRSHIYFPCISSHVNLHLLLCAFVWHQLPFFSCSLSTISAPNTGDSGLKLTVPSRTLWASRMMSTPLCLTKATPMMML
jgi:hypothetical protein